MHVLRFSLRPNPLHIERQVPPRMDKTAFSQERDREFMNSRPPPGRAKAIARPSYVPIPMGRCPIFGENRPFVSRGLCTIKIAILIAPYVSSTSIGTDAMYATRRSPDTAYCPRFSTPCMVSHAPSPPLPVWRVCPRHRHHACLCAYIKSCPFRSCLCIWTTTWPDRLSQANSPFFPLQWT